MDCGLVFWIDYLSDKRGGYCVGAKIVFDLHWDVEFMFDIACGGMVRYSCPRDLDINA